MRVHTILPILTAGLMWADAGLKAALGLSMDQARQVDAIEQRYQRPYAAKRSERDQQMRKLRRARIANDAPGAEREEKAARALHEQLMAMQAQRDGEVRRLLNPDQEKKFDAYLKTRREMAGSSRDDKPFTGR